MQKYVRIFYDRPSVLDKYEDETDLEIRSTVSLESLLKQYDKVYNDVIEFEKGKTEEELNSINIYGNEHYVSKSKYMAAIVNWESKEEMIHEVIAFWIIGFFFITVSYVIFFIMNIWATGPHHRTRFSNML